MGTRDESLREIVRGLDGLVMLSQWEQTLAKDLRDKAESLEASGRPPEAEKRPGNSGRA